MPRVRLSDISQTFRGSRTSRLGESLFRGARPFVLAACLLLAISGVSRAQVAPRPSAYPGVVPGSSNPPPAAERIHARRGRGRGARAAILTWPGFQALPGGGSRFFVQTTAHVATEVRALADRVEVVFPNTTIHLANSARWLETQHFNTPVLRARLERRGRDMVFVMHLRAASVPRVTQAPGEGPWSFTFVEFDPGQWIAPEPPRAPSAASGGGLGVVGAGPSPESLPPEPATPPRPRPIDDERPPPIQGPRPKP